MIHLDCDYMQGAHPEVLQALIDTNLESVPGYGCDHFTKRAKEKIKVACEAPNATVHLLVGGTQTNATVIDGVLAHHEGVLSAESGHINVHESGAIEATGHKVLTLPQYDGKVKAEDVKNYIDNFYADDTYEHMVAPGMLYISNPTEYGTVYTLEELKSLSKVCRDANIPLYMDGARLGYALAVDGYDVTLKDIATLCDIFYIGGTKVGALFGEAVVVTKENLLPHFFPLIKQHGALLAKGRLLGVQFDALFTNDLYKRIGEHAVSLAMKIKNAFQTIGYQPFIDSPTNQQFFHLPNSIVDQIATFSTFEYWGPRGEESSTIRMVTSWATTTQEIDELVTKIISL